MRAWGRLLRLSLAPSAAADIACGIVLGAGGWPGGGWPWLLILASLCVYHGGMALNDWADRADDRRLRPERPLPSGAIAPGAALGLALLLLAAGPLLARAAGPRPALLCGAVAASACAYDLAGRGPWLGPALLALCRAGNLGTGIVAGLAAAADPRPAPAAWLVPLLYGGYVLCVSRLGRLEDAEGDLGRAPSFWLGAAALLQLAIPGCGALERPMAALGAGALAVLGASGLLRAALARDPWTRPRVLGAMGMALRRLLVVTAAAALLAPAPAGPLVAAAILCGFPVAYVLRGVFPPS